ncbi:MAG: hypothetical protein HY319_07080 [Armatimonadetes bacterium]|nr:hypothetical protein [Armatimonadota bacterium]
MEVPSPSLLMEIDNQTSQISLLGNQMIGGSVVLSVPGPAALVRLQLRDNDLGTGSFSIQASDYADLCAEITGNVANRLSLESYSSFFQVVNGTVAEFQAINAISQVILLGVIDEDAPCESLWGW